MVTSMQHRLRYVEMQIIVLSCDEIVIRDLIKLCAMIKTTRSCLQCYVLVTALRNQCFTYSTKIKKVVNARGRDRLISFVCNLKINSISHVVACSERL